MLSIFKNICIKNKQKCLLCSLPHSEDSELCRPCLEDLPWANLTCFQCGLPLNAQRSGYLCGQCLQHPPPYTNTTAAFLYLFPINALLPRLKSSRGLHHHHWMTDCLIRQINNRHQALPEILIPVPIHITRRITRGFNQSEWICRHLSQSLHIPTDYVSLTKVKASKAQAQLDSFNRRRNLKAHFRYQGPAYSHVAVIDDVMTTGTTAAAIAKTLLLAGVQQVDIWVLARTPEPDFLD